MAEYGYSDEDRQRWAKQAGEAVAKAAERTRKKMAARIKGMASMPSSAAAVFNPADWMYEVDQTIAPAFHEIADEAAGVFAEGVGADVDSGLRALFVGLIAVEVAEMMASRGDVVTARVDELISRDPEAAAEVLIDQLGLGDEILSGPLSDALGEAMGVSASTALAEGASVGVIDAAGLVGYKTWHCMFANSRESHMDADMQTVPVEEPFVLEGGEGMYPGDPDLPPEEAINCQCWLTYSVETPQGAEPADEDAAIQEAADVLEEEAAGATFATFGGPGSGPHPVSPIGRIARDLNRAKTPTSKEPVTEEIQKELADVRGQIYFDREGGGREIVETVNRFQSGAPSHDIRLAADAIVHSGPPFDRPIMNDARTLLTLVAEAPHIEGTLQRGIALDEIPQPGQVIDDPLGAWSGSAEIPGRMLSGRMSRAEKAGETKHPVVLVVTNPKAVNISPLNEPYAQGANIAKISAEEFLSGGRFRVTGVEPSTRTSAAPRRDGSWMPRGDPFPVTVVYVEQEEIYTEFAVEPPVIVIPADQASLLDDADLADEEAFSTFGGPGSGPRPGGAHPHAGSGKGIKSPPPVGLPTSTGTEAMQPGEQATAEVMAAALGRTPEDLQANVKDVDTRVAMRAAAVERVAAGMEKDPKFQAWVGSEQGQKALETTIRWRNDLEDLKEGDVVPVADAAALMASSYIDTWAKTSAGTDIKAWAVQSVAADLFGLDPADPQLGESSMKLTESTIGRERPAIEAYLKSSYEATQADLKAAGVETLTVARGFVGNVPPTVASGELINPDGTAGQAVAVVGSNPLSSWSTNREVADSFALGTADININEYETPMDPVNYRYVVTSEVPRERIFSMPSSGPGCLPEHEVVVLGDSRFEAVIDPMWNERGSWGGYSTRWFAVARAKATKIDEGANGDWPKRTPDTAADLDTETAGTMKSSTFGGPGSGPRAGGSHPHAGAGKGAGKAPIPVKAPITAPKLQVTDPETGRTSEAVKEALTDSNSSLMAAMSGASGAPADDINSAVTDIGTRGEFKAIAVANVAAGMEKDPKFQAWAETPEGQKSIDDARAHIISSRGPEAAMGPASEMMAQRYIDHWAETAGDHSGAAMAIQTVAAETFGVKSDHLPSGMEDTREYKGTLSDQGPAIRSFIESSYRETQSQLAAAGVESVTVARGFVPGPNGGPPELREASEAEVRVSSNPLTSWTTNADIADYFMGKGTSGINLLAEIPAERIFSIPTSGPGCLPEHEMIVIGANDFTVRATTYGLGFSMRQTFAAADPLYIDEPPQDDWPKRTPDTMADLAAGGTATASIMFGGPGSGPRAGGSHPHAGAGKGKGSKAETPERPEGKVGSFTIEGPVPEADRAMIEATMKDLSARFPIGHVRVRFASGDDAITGYANAQGGDPLTPASADDAKGPNPEERGLQAIHVNADAWAALHTPEGYAAAAEADRQADAERGGYEYQPRASPYGDREKEMGFALVDSSPTGTITHEYGHLVEHALLRAGADPDELTAILTGDEYDTNDAPSLYGMENRSEMAAELFSAYVTESPGVSWNADGRYQERVARYGALIERTLGGGE